MGIPLFEGRTLERLDPASAPREAVVSRSFAQRYWMAARHSPTDPLAFAAAALLLGLVGLVASLIPARRAARVDPLTALRIE